jgi:hypothetical protein
MPAQLDGPQGTENSRDQSASPFGDALTEVVKKLQNQILIFALGALILLTVLLTATRIGWPALIAFLLVFLMALGAYVVTQAGMLSRRRAVPRRFEQAGQDRRAFGLTLWTETETMDGQARPGRRDLEIAPDARPRYRIGDRIRVCFRADVDCRLTLLDMGTSNAVTVLFPNAYVPGNQVQAGKTYRIPAAGQGFSYRVGGPPGIEHIKAVASHDADPLTPPAAPADATFAVLTRRASVRDIDIVANSIDSLDPASSAIATHSFLVEPGQP